MTDSILRSYYNVSSSMFVPFAVSIPGALGMLSGETQGFAIDATTELGTVAVIDTGTPSNNLSNVILDASNLLQTGTSPKLMQWDVAPLARWTPHNMFLNSAAPATQNVTLVVGFVYTVSVTGAGGGSITGSAGASGVATTGSPATFTATTTTGTFTYAATLTTIQLNRGPIATPYLATTGSIRIGIPQGYDLAASRFAMMPETDATNLCLFSDDLTNAAWTKSTMSTAKTATGPDNGTNSATTLTASAGNATALQAITSASSTRVTGVWIKRRTGTGNIDLTQDNGGTWTTQAVTGTWTRFTLATVTSTNPTIGIRIVTNADAVDVFGFQHETSGSSIVTSTIPTVGTTATRARDIISGLTSTIPSMDNIGTLFSYNKLQTGQPGGGSTYSLYTPTVFRDLIDGPGNQWNITSGADIDFNIGSAVDTNSHKTGAAYNLPTNAYGCVDGGTITTDSTVSTRTFGNFGIAGFSDGVRTSMIIYKMMFLPRAMTSGQLQTLTA